MKFTLQPILPAQINDLIRFDKIHLLDVMKKIGINNDKCSPLLTHAELTAAFQRKDFLFWIYLNDNLAGYMWREKRHDCLFGSGAALKQEFYGTGLSHFIIESTENLARQAGLSLCRTTVIPENGRVISIYMKHGYRIIKYVLVSSDTTSSPMLFRCLLEKNIENPESSTTVLDCHEVFCTDYRKIKMLIDSGYQGIRYIVNSKEDTSKNKIVFELSNTD